MHILTRRDLELVILNLESKNIKSEHWGAKKSRWEVSRESFGYNVNLASISRKVAGINEYEYL